MLLMNSLCQLVKNKIKLTIKYDNVKLPWVLGKVKFDERQ